MLDFLQYRYLKYILVLVSEIQNIHGMSMGYEHMGDIMTHIWIHLHKLVCTIERLRKSIKSLFKRTSYPSSEIA